MGAVYYLLRFVTRGLATDPGTRDLSRALAFGCGSVLAGFSLLDAFLGLVGVAFVFLAIRNRVRAKKSVVSGSECGGGLATPVQAVAPDRRGHLHFSRAVSRRSTLGASLRARDDQRPRSQ